MRIFEEFIGTYIQNLIDGSDGKYNLTEKDKQEIIEDINYDDDIWNLLDYKIFEKLENFRIEGDE